MCKFLIIFKKFLVQFFFRDLPNLIIVLLWVVLDLSWRFLVFSFYKICDIEKFLLYLYVCACVIVIYFNYYYIFTVYPFWFAFSHLFIIFTPINKNYVIYFLCITFWLIIFLSVIVYFFGFYSYFFFIYEFFRINFFMFLPPL